MTAEFNLDIVPTISPRSGNEPIVAEDGSTGATLADFWSWSSSDLLGNSLRGVLAEYRSSAAPWGASMAPRAANGMRSTCAQPTTCGLR